MPAMANGGMQRGLYGRAESPYNERFHRRVRVGFVQRFGHSDRGQLRDFRAGGDLVQWSCPATNNALCAYTPSRGVISAGNWPLVPTMDVALYPHTRTMADMAEVLDVIVADDADTRGDLAEPTVDRHPAASKVRPGSYREIIILTNAIQLGRYWRANDSVFPMYINADPESRRLARGAGYRQGPPGNGIETRQSVIDPDPFRGCRLIAAGADVVLVDFPGGVNYECDRAGAPSITPAAWSAREFLQS